MPARMPTQASLNARRAATRGCWRSVTAEVDRRMSIVLLERTCSTMVASRNAGAGADATT